MKDRKYTAIVNFKTALVFISSLAFTTAWAQTFVTTVNSAYEAIGSTLPEKPDCVRAMKKMNLDTDEKLIVTVRNLKNQNVDVKLRVDFCTGKYWCTSDSSLRSDVLSKIGATVFKIPAQQIGCINDQSGAPFDRIRLSLILGKRTSQTNIKLGQNTLMMRDIQTRRPYTVAFDNKYENAVNVVLQKDLAKGSEAELQLK